MAVILRRMTVTVNGEPRALPDGQTVRAVVADFRLTPEKVAIELNRRLLRSDKYDTALKDGDELEIVTFVGGG
jgi:sulfur carrier protein